MAGQNTDSGVDQDLSTKLEGKEAEIEAVELAASGSNSSDPIKSPPVENDETKTEESGLVNGDELVQAVEPMVIDLTTSINKICARGIIDLESKRQFRVDVPGGYAVVELKVLMRKL